MGRLSLPSHEIERLVALARYDILDSVPELAFDNITELAVEVLGVTMAAVNFITDDRQWCKSSAGVAPLSMPIALSPCAATISHGSMLEVENPVADPRFAGSVLALVDPPPALYAGVPLVTEDGYAIGTLCVVDLAPHSLSERERRILQRLARMAMDELELRAARHRLEVEAQARSQMLESMRQTGQMSDALAAVAALSDLDLDLPDLVQTAADLLGQVMGLGTLALYEIGAGGPSERVAWHARDLADAGALLPGAARLAQMAKSVLDSGSAHFEDDREPGAEEATGASRPLAWLPLTPRGAAPFLLVCARHGRTRSWRRRERSLLETTAHSLARALERREELQRERLRACTDELTGLGNLRAFHQDLDARLSMGEPFALLMLDLDRFRQVNESQGQARGDTLLRLFAQAMLAEWRPQDAVYRLGGDELAVLIGDAAEWPGSELLEDWALEHVDVAVSVARLAGFHTIGASSGLALYPQDGFEGRALIEHADRQMFLAKRSRRARRGDDLPAGSSGALSELRLNLEQHEAQFRGQAVRLRPKESELLALLTRDPQRIFSREELSGRLWEGETPPSGNVLEVHLTNLRKKLSGIAPHIKIRAVRGQGYNLVVESS